MACMHTALKIPHGLRLRGLNVEEEAGKSQRAQWLSQELLLTSTYAQTFNINGGVIDLSAHSVPCFNSGQIYNRAMQRFRSLQCPCRLCSSYRFEGAQTQILPANSKIKVPIMCTCVNGIRKSVSTVYQVKQVDTLQSIAESVFGGLVTSDQLKDANKIAASGILDVGQTLVIPLPCTCFNGTDNGLPAVYMSYVVRDGDSLISIGRVFATTVTDLMGVNSLQSSLITAGDIIAVPLSACSSSNLNLSSDSGLLVANGSYAITANGCVQCNCGPNEMNLHCVQSTLGTSCPSMQCNSSNLLIGDAIEQQTSAGCNVTACLYGGYRNGTIVESLKNFLQPQCLGKYLGPVYTKPPTLPATTTRNSTIPESPSSAMSPSSHTIGVVKSNPASQPLGSSCPTNEPLSWLSLLSILITVLPCLIHVCNR